MKTRLSNKQTPLTGAVELRDGIIPSWRSTDDEMIWWVVLRGFLQPLAIGQLGNFG
jgi:hypothetical protein